jgi:hypothetical protein
MSFRGTLMKALIPLVAMTFAAALFSNPVVAQTAEEYHPFLTDNFRLGVGLFSPKKSITLRVDGSSPEDEIDFDEALGIDDNDLTGLIDFRWRFGEKWSFGAQYWSTSSSGGAVLDEDVEWEDVVFKAGTFAHAGVDAKIARAFFGRKITSGPQYEFGLGAGFHWMEMDAFIEGEIFIDDNTTDFHRASVNAAFPLPNIGGWYMYSWSPKWLFQARLDWLSASIGDYSGGLWDAQTGVHWQAFKNVGFGLYFNGFVLDVDVDKESWHGKAESKNYGPLLRLTASW